MNGYRTIVSASVVIVVEIFRILGWTVDKNDVQFVLESIVAICAAAAAIYYRIRARVRHGME